jgi:hypothetical protein
VFLNPVGTLAFAPNQTQPMKARVVVLLTSMNIAASAGLDGLARIVKKKSMNAIQIPAKTVAHVLTR